MNKIIIPRRDHEVYFIRIPEDITTKQTQHFVTEQLDRLHPTFSAASVLDFQQFVFNKTRWVMATVMEAEKFAEYKILNNGTAFFTNTSITIREKDFLHAGIKTIDDERIGFDAEKNSPVSTPSESKDNGIQELTPALKTIPARHGVYGKKIPQRHIALAGSIIALLLLISFAFVLTSKNAAQIQVPIIQSIPIIETKQLPFATEILARVAFDIVNAGGEMQLWQHNEDTDPLIFIQSQGIDVLAAHQILGQYEYAFLQEIKNVNYSDGNPQITINMNASRAKYTIPPATMFPEQRFCLPLMTELTNTFQQNEIYIASEVLPTAGNAFYTIIFYATDKSLIRSMEIITDMCKKYPLWVKKMDISISSDKHTFTVAAVLAYSDTPSKIEIISGDSMNIIPLAFGYVAPAPPITPRANVMAEKKSEPPLIGSIRDGSVNVTFYRDTSDGKIKVRGKQ